VGVNEGNAVMEEVAWEIEGDRVELGKCSIGEEE
jgi:hypothetical protein